MNLVLLKRWDTIPKSIKSSYRLALAGKSACQAAKYGIQGEDIDD